MEGRRCEDVIGGEVDHRCHGGDGVLVTERDKTDRGAYRGSHKEKNSPKLLIGKMRWADFHDF